MGLASVRIANVAILAVAIFEDRAGADELLWIRLSKVTSRECR